MPEGKESSCQLRSLYIAQFSFFALRSLVPLAALLGSPLDEEPTDSSPLVDGRRSLHLRAKCLVDDIYAALERK